MSAHHCVACDLGAESCPVMLGTLAEGRLTLEEIHRFANGPVRVNGTLRWDAAVAAAPSVDGWTDADFW